MARNLPRRVNRFLLRNRLLIFLITLLLLLLIFPFIYERYTGYMVVLELFFSLALIAGIYAVSANRELLTIAILLGLLTFTIIWFNIYIQSRDLLFLGLFLEIVFFSITTVTILTHVLQYKKVSVDKIYGAICGYLLIGVVWALVYTMIENAYPGSFAFQHGFLGIRDSILTHPFYFVHFIYYSFVTMTTLGYGDITPITGPARAFASLEAVAGQLYVAVLIARLVGLHIIHAHRQLDD